MLRTASARRSRATLAIMNKRKIQQCLNYRIRLRPIPRRIWHGREQELKDWVWHVEAVNNDGVVTLRNISTGHVAKLGADHIRNFDSDTQNETDGFRHGFLTLKGEVMFRDGEFVVEPNRIQGSSNR